MSRLILGIPLKYVLAALAVLVGGTTVAGTGVLVVALAVVQDGEALLPVSEAIVIEEGEALPPVSETPAIEVVFQDPAGDSMTVTVPLVSPSVPTVTLPVTPPLVLTITVPIAPPVDPISPTGVLTKPGISGLAFHQRWRRCRRR